MEHEKFTNWLKGFLDSNGNNELDKKKLDLIKKKLDSVLEVEKEVKVSKRIKIGADSFSSNKKVC